MAQQKLYQWLQGENQGKVVSLVGVEAEDNMTFLKFEDGSRCNVEFAAKLNDARAFTDGKFVAEVCDRKNIWSFQDNSLKDDVRYGTLKSGEVVTGWDPYMHGKDGVENRSRNSIKAIPPRHTVTQKEMQSSSEKLKELGIDPSTPGYEEGIKNLTIPTQANLQSQLMGKGGISNKPGGNYENVEHGNIEGLGKTTIGLDPTGAKAPSMKDLEQYQRATEIYIPDEYREPNNTSSEPKEASVSLSRKVDKTVETIMAERDEAAEQKKSGVNTSSPIYSIVSKCKKKDVQAPLILNLKLPGKSIYNLIKEEYEDEAIDEFFDIILNDISIDEIKKSLKSALKASYEPSVQEEAE